MKSAAATREDRLRRLSRGRGQTLAALGFVFLGLGILFLVMWALDRTGDGQRTLLFAGGVPFAAFGIALLIGGGFEAFQWPGYRIIRWFPVVAFVLIVFSCDHML